MRTALPSGRLFIVSFPEEAPADRTLHFIQDNRIGGVILFADHCRSQDGLRSWLGDFKKTLDYNLIVAVDQEGGRVRRFQRNFPALESPRYYGHKQDITSYQNDLAHVCERLYEIGVNLNLVPTVDLFDTQKDHVLDSRTFSDDMEIVRRFAEETIARHREHRLLTCAKHFPGLGRSCGDPHRVSSVADLSEEDCFEKELKPFEAVIAYGVDAIMVTHVSIPRVDDRPAIVSEKIIKGWLKDRLAFAGAVITDDLLMEGAAEAAPHSQLAIKSFEAGADILLFGQNLKKAKQAFDTFSEYWDSGKFNTERMADACTRVDTLAKKISRD